MQIIELTDDYDRALVNGYVAREETRERMSRDRDNFRSIVGRNRGRDYLDRFDNFSRSLDIDLLARRSISLGRTMRGAFRDDYIYDMFEVEDFQQATDRMASYLLADPTINRWGRQHRMECWGRNSEDFGYTGEDEDDYRDSPYYRAYTQGMMRENREGKMVTTSYLGQTEDDMDMLSYDEKFAIIKNQALCRALLSESGNEDPTSPGNNLF